MAVPGINGQGCDRRNRLEGLRSSVPTAPVRFAAGPLPPPTGMARRRLVGMLPEDDGAALELLNRQQAAARRPALAAEQVRFFYPEAGNSNFVPDRFAFLGNTTLIRVAKAANGGGFALMNSHRTGAMSTPSELPFGRAFCGRYERFQGDDGASFSRCQLGVYLPLGIRPNGANGPSTDDLAAGIDAGTIFDVSLGLTCPDDRREFDRCRVCGADFMAVDDRGDYACPHLPGTHLGMNDGEIEAQAASGVPDGLCSVIFENYTAGEVSAVYDGAVPGAGFAKGRTLARRHRLAPAAKREFAERYGRFLTDRSRRLFLFPDRPRGPAMPKFVSAAKILSALGVSIEDTDLDPEATFDVDQLIVPPNGQHRNGSRADFSDGVDPVPPKAPAPPPAPTPPPALSADPAFIALQAELNETRARLAQQSSERRLERITSEGANWLGGQKRLGKISPQQLAPASALYIRLALLDSESPPVAGQTALLDDFKALVGAGQANAMFSQLAAEDLPPGAASLRPALDGPDGSNNADREQTLRRRLEHYPALKGMQDEIVKRVNAATE